MRVQMGHRHRRHSRTGDWTHNRLEVRTGMMNPQIEKVVDRLLQSYSTYYDIETCDDQDLVAKASFHSRGEKS